MQIISQSAEIVFPKTSAQAVEQLRLVEEAGRNCYHSGDKITADSYVRFIRSLMKNGHFSPLEFAHIAVKLVTSRDVLAELTRHRLASFAVESQRYVLESGTTGNIPFIRPQHYAPNTEEWTQWCASCLLAEDSYKAMLERGCKKEDARKVLPNSTACTIYMSANLREWLHIFKLRTSLRAYPEMRYLMQLILEAFDRMFPELDLLQIFEEESK